MEEKGMSSHNPGRFESGPPATNFTSYDMTSQEDLRVFRLIAEHFKKIEKQIRWIRIVLWFVVGVLASHIMEHCGK
jgi:hypothetical protein